MAIEVETTGNGRFLGHKSDVVSYSYSEQSTPHMVGDESGGVGDISVEVADFRNDGIVLYKDNMTLTDDLYGSITGRIDSLTSSNGVIGLTGRSRLALLNTPGVIAPATTTIRGLFESIFTAAGVIDDVAFDPLISTTPITTPGYDGDLWVFTKQACATYQVQVSLIDNTIYVQPIRQREITVENIDSDTYSITDVDLAQSFNVAYYNYTEEVGALAFPRGGWNPEVPVYQVEANETVVFDIPIEGYLTSVKQPVIQDLVPVDYAGSDSVYSVSGNDNLPVPAALWADFGGSLTVELVQNGTAVRVTIIGPNFPEISPYSISVSDGSTAYSTLRLIGDGVFYDKKLLNIKTGLTPDISPTEVGTDIDNPFVDTLDQAWDVGVKTRQLYALPRHTIELSGRSFVRKNYTQYEYFELDDATYGLLDGEGVLAFVDLNESIALFQSFEEYANELPVGYSFTEFNDDYVNSSFEDFSRTVVETFSQSFGAVSGSRAKYYDAYFRIRSTEISQDRIAITAEFDTLFSDFDETFATYTFEDFAEIAPGLTFNDWALIPLRTDPYITFDYLFLDDADKGLLDVQSLGFPQ
jgi:hypothetical protein